MKTTVKFFALLTVVLTLAACNKDKDDLRHERDIVYTVAEQTSTVHLTTDAEFDALLDRFCDYAQEGSSVTFYNVGLQDASAPKGTKDAVTYSTTSREEMKAWMRRMEDAGMTVTVTHDPATGTWNGTAYATAPQPPLPSGGLVTYECDGMNDFGYIMSFDTVNRRVYITLHYTLQNITAPDYPEGMYEYRHADEVNTPFAYWFIDSWGDTAGLYNLEIIGSDTLHFNSTHLSNPATLVRTDGWQTYLCNIHGLGIVMHVSGNVIEVYPEVYIGQMGVHGLGYIDVVWPFGYGRFEMWRTEMAQPAMDIPCWGLTLDFRPFGGTDVLDGFIIQGVPFTDSQFTITKGSQFVFQRL